MQHSIEGLIFLLVIAFYILRGIYRGVQAFFGMVRRALVPAQRVIAEEVRRTAPEQMRQSVASQQPGARPPQPRTTPTRARQPEAGGAAVTDTASSSQFRTQVAQLEAQESRGRAVSAPDSVATDDVPPLFRGGDDLVRAVILQEVLGKPLSQRRRGMPYKVQAPGSQQ